MKRLFITFILLNAFVTIAHAQTMNLTSSDIAHADLMENTQEFQGFGCSGGNQSPQLSWSDIPAGTKAFAVTAYDPDAPTGSGCWLWQLVNIPVTETSLPSNAGNIKGQNIPKGAIHISNDYGVKAFGGACPPEGHGAHRYQFTVHALKEVLSLPDDASGALAGYMINANSLGNATIEAL